MTDRGKLPGVKMQCEGRGALKASYIEIAYNQIMANWAEHVLLVHRSEIGKLIFVLGKHLHHLYLSQVLKAVFY